MEKLQLRRTTAEIDNKQILFGQSYINDLLDSMLAKSKKEWSKHVEDYIRKNLSDLNINFNSDDEFYQFCKDRLTRICWNPPGMEWEVRLDYKNEMQNGVCVGFYSERTRIEQKEGIYTIKIG